jgi:hypothetical protein
MKNLHPRFSRFGLGLAMAAGILFSAVESQGAIIAFTGFETSGSTWGVSTPTGTGSFSTETGATMFPASQNIFAGSRSLQMNGGSSTTDFDAVDISGFDSVQITLRISSTATGSSNGNDTNDLVNFFVALNGAAFSTTSDLIVAGFSNALWGFNAALTATTTAGAPRVTARAPQTGNDTNNYSTVVINIPSTATSVDFKIVGLNDNAGEFWNIDNVTLSGNAKVPEPSSFVAMVGGMGMLCGFRRLRSSGRKA